MLSPELAINASITGPMLRASGVNYDIRKVDNYGIYDRFRFPRAARRSRRCVRSLHDPRAGNAASRSKFWSRRSRKFLPDRSWIRRRKLRGFRPKAGEATAASKRRKANLAFILISDGSPNPYRYRVRPPSLINLTVLGRHVPRADGRGCVVILGSVDIVLGEVDR